MVRRELEHNIPSLLSGGSVAIIVAPLFGLITGWPAVGFVLGFCIGFSGESWRRHEGVFELARIGVATLLVSAATWFTPYLMALMAGTALLVVVGGVFTHWHQDWWFPGPVSTERPDHAIRLCAEIARRAGDPRPADSAVKEMIQILDAPERRVERFEQYRRLTQTRTDIDLSIDVLNTMMSDDERRYLVQVMQHIVLSAEALNPAAFEQIDNYAERLGVNVEIDYETESDRTAHAKPSDETAEIETVPERVRRACNELGVQLSDSFNVIKRAYRRRAREHHPDTVDDPEAVQEAEKKMSAINKAYRTLREYNEQ